MLSITSLSYLNDSMFITMNISSEEYFINFYDASAHKQSKLVTGKKIIFLVLNFALMKKIYQTVSSFALQCHFCLANTLFINVSSWLPKLNIFKGKTMVSLPSASFCERETFLSERFLHFWGHCLGFYTLTLWTVKMKK